MTQHRNSLHKTRVKERRHSDGIAVDMHGSNVLNRITKTHLRIKIVSLKPIPRVLWPTTPTKRGYVSYTTYFVALFLEAIVCYLISGRGFNDNDTVLVGSNVSNPSCVLHTDLILLKTSSICILFFIFFIGDDNITRLSDGRHMSRRGGASTHKKKKELMKYTRINLCTNYIHKFSGSSLFYVFN
uniref:Uncharacterized protein LOC104266792 n=1 Tax=Phallusia mammillata TaxID=59560 RepID=A0A6F9DJ60_9ASCI|nr:uncharacterized protein LOC104266792 [Phallusia mammillata]